MPFVAWIPSSHVFRHFTVRNDGKKWNTIRYFVEINGREIRVKEFFMDWFFPGFPKSLMDTLYSTYSPVTALERDGRLLFLGTNYKGNPAASGYLDGTTVEIESLSGEAMEEMTELFFDLAADPDDEASKCDMPFHERSFFSAGHQGAWFEDNRISRMSWKKGEPGIGINEYSLSSVGTLANDSGLVQAIHVFQNRCFNRAFWVETARRNADFEHAYYRMRNETGVMNAFHDDGYFLSWREPSGPFLGQSMNDSAVITVGGSAFVDLELPRDILSFGQTLQSLSAQDTQFRELSGI